MPQVWLQSRFGSLETFIPVKVTGRKVGDEVDVELPWSDRGEPAGPLRPGQLALIPMSALIVCDERPRRRP